MYLPVQVLLVASSRYLDSDVRVRESLKVPHYNPFRSALSHWSPVCTVEGRSSPEVPPPLTHVPLCRTKGGGQDKMKLFHILI